MRRAFLPKIDTALPNMFFNSVGCLDEIRYGFCYVLQVGLQCPNPSEINLKWLLRLYTASCYINIEKIGYIIYSKTEGKTEIPYYH